VAVLLKISPAIEILVNEQKINYEELYPEKPGVYRYGIPLAMLF
jgi:hypothetical protein